jgi:hypothetical protein
MRCSLSERATPRFGPAQDWGRIRTWDGTQQRAFEELCFQLRDAAPAEWQTTKTAAPDGGVEWYDHSNEGVVHGFQAKFVDSIDKLLPLARESAKTVGANRSRRNVVRLVFLAPIDLPDPAETTRTGKDREGARQKWTKKVALWKKELPGLADMDIELVGSGELLERLTRPGNEGRRWFFFEQLALGPDWCRQQFAHAELLASDRYTPERHLPLPLEQVFEGLSLTEPFRRLVFERVSDAQAGVAELRADWDGWLAKHGGTARALLVDAVPTGTPNQQFKERLTTLLDRAEDALSLVRDCLVPPDAERGFAAAEAVEIVTRCGSSIRKFVHEGYAVVDRLRMATRMPASSALAGTPGEGDSSTRDDESRRAKDPVWSLSRLIDGKSSNGAVGRSLEAVRSLIGFLSSERCRAAETKSWLLLGGPGQGKTHLLLDAVGQTIARGGAGVVVLGEQLSGEDPLTEIARVLGLGDLSYTAFLEALDTAGAITGSRFLLVVDALNDSDNATQWRTRLLDVLGRVTDFDHIAVVFSCRTTMKDIVLPADVHTWVLPISDHPGFRGREVEGLERYLADVPHALPRTPLLQAAFGNPLFVKLYAESLRKRAAAARSVAVVGGAHRSEVFMDFLDGRAEAICHELGLDSALRPVHRAVKALAERMASSGFEVLPRDEAAAIVTPMAPYATAWPRTMLGQLISRGVLATDRYPRPGAEPDAGVAFPYQAFSDDLVVRAALELHADELAGFPNNLPLVAESPLRLWLEDASPNLREAATIILPELVEVELIDVLGASGTASQDGVPDERSSSRYELFRALARTLPLRSGSSVTPRTRDLLNKTLEHGVDNAAMLDAVVAVSTEPGHLLNATSLHRTLTALEANERDAAWSSYTYGAYQEVGPLHRLLRWAEQLPTPPHLLPQRQAPRSTLTVRRVGARVQSPQPADGLSAEVVELAATVLVWTLTSSHRFLRDRATKALIQLLLGFPDVLVALLDKFLGQDAARIDDLYLFARLVLVAEGVVLRTGHAQPDAVSALARRVAELVYTHVDSPTHVSRSVMLCDAAHGVMTAAHRFGVLDDTDLAKTAHPHPAPAPGEIPAEDELERRLPRDHATTTTETSWSSLWMSLDHQVGDFGRYVVGNAMSQFSRLPVERPRPEEKSVRDRRPTELIPDRIAAFRASLPDEVQDVLASPAAVLRLLADGSLAEQVLDEEQQQLLALCFVPPTEDEQLLDLEQDDEWACRWILTRVAELGWSPQMFGAFDRFRPRYVDGAHKPERIGKKYQWIAFHDLLERLANHYHLATKWAEVPRLKYRGGWEFGVRDIDPSLPPTSHPLPDQDDEPASRVGAVLGHTFPPGDTSEFWAPGAPTLPARDGISAWIHDGTTIPSAQDTCVRIDSDGTRWIPLTEFAKDSPAGYGFASAARQAEQWHIISSWLIAKNQTPHVVDFLAERSLIPKWMPEDGSPHGIYLSEYADADAARDLDDDHSGFELRHVDYTTPSPRSKESRQDRESELYALLAGRYSTVSTVHDLAAQWSGPGDHDSSPWWDGTPPDGLTYGVEDTGTALRAIPATVSYSSSGSEADCSLNKSVLVYLPTNELLRGSGLVRHPDRADWHDTTGALTVTCRWGTRPTGEVRTLLARQDWLTDRLDELGYDLIVGLIGELQTTRGVPEVWRQFSRCLQLQDDGSLSTVHALEQLRRRRE